MHDRITYKQYGLRELLKLAQAVLMAAVESEVAKELDLSVIRYSRVAEDHRVLSCALQIEVDHDVVMCITRYRLH